ncbi:MAG: DUF3604 domain-containing protein [Gammaproteobacteria bacterium]|nr:DUF3604 domain-containing protein [Gammaproteobacteria bacterium]
MARRILVLIGLAILNTSLVAEDQPSNRQALFGDLHVHTRLSFDAWGFGVRTSPDDAYRFAKGEAIDHPSGYTIQLDRPLDFYAVTDHGMYLGVLDAAANPDHPMSQREGAENIKVEMSYIERRQTYGENFAFARENPDEEVQKSAWRRIIDAAEQHNDPGKLTTFIAYEFTSSIGGNLHRNVIFAGSNAPEKPFSRLDSPNPEDLWRWMDEQRGSGIELIAIPHNANKSNGRMFETTTFDGEPLTAEYADFRMRNEPLVEVTQVKGTSETHPFLSPEDEWAGFEITYYRVASWLLSQPSGSYVRDAYKKGLAMQNDYGFNPYRFGLVGASDSHNAGFLFEEENYIGKIGQFDGLPVHRGSVPVTPASDEAPAAYARNYFGRWSSAGLAAVWAEENTRESIFSAFRRKETFATSGPRIRVRLFAGYGLPEDLNSPDLLDDAYEGGVPMGGDLALREEGVPSLLAWAAADPRGAPLARLQIVKVWVEGNDQKEAVYDVACSDGLEVDAETNRCPENGAEVNLEDCSITEGVGAATLLTRWEDPDFANDQRAAYYLRALENPTCRWSTWDAIRADVSPRPDLPRTLSERAWSSPIWFEPSD